IATKIAALPPRFIIEVLKPLRPSAKLLTALLVVLNNFVCSPKRIHLNTSKVLHRRFDSGRHCFFDQGFMDGRLHRRKISPASFEGFGQASLRGFRGFHRFEKPNHLEAPLARGARAELIFSGARSLQAAGATYPPAVTSF